VKLKNQSIIVTGGASGAVAPGFSDTPVLGKDAAMKDRLAKQHLHGKLIEPEQVASVLAFYSQMARRPSTGRQSRSKTGSRSSRTADTARKGGSQNMRKLGLGPTLRAVVFATWLRIKPLHQKLAAFAHGFQRRLATTLNSATSRMRRPCLAI
jgi:hypothetical protein